MVTPAAALDGSHFGLELRLDDPASGRRARAFVAIGPEKGVRNETTLEVGFTLDPRGLVVTSAGGPGRLSFLRLGRGRAGLVVFLEQIPLNAWSIGAWSWDDATGRLVLAGQASLPFADPTGGPTVPPRVEVEWAAASRAPARSRGYLRILSVAEGGERALLLENTGLDNASQRIGYVELGVRTADDAAGVSGRLLIDNVQLTRSSPPLQASRQWKRGVAKDGRAEP